MNRIGPSVLPWGTPLITDSHSKNAEFRGTHCFRLLRKSLIQCNKLPVIPYLLIYI